MATGATKHFSNFDNDESISKSSLIWAPLGPKGCGRRPPRSPLLLLRQLLPPHCHYTWWLERFHFLTRNSWKKELSFSFLIQYCSIVPWHLQASPCIHLIELYFMNQPVVTSVNIKGGQHVISKGLVIAYFCSESTKRNLSNNIRRGEQ